MLSSRNRRSIGGWLACAIVAGGALFAVYVSQAAGADQAGLGKDPGAVTLNPASGPTSSTPTWHTTVACPSGFQGSATFKEVHADGTSTNFIAPIVNKTAAPFSGTLQASITQIQKAGGIPNGGTQELFVTCYSQYSGTGNAQNEMDIYITYSADGTSYKTTATPSSGTSTGGGGASSTPSSTGAGSGSTPLSSVTPSPSPSSPAPSPSPFDSSFAVTG